MSPDAEVELRLAASVLLVRDRTDPPPGVEVFMAERHADSVFVGGAHVFPGGRVEPDDAVDAGLCAGLDDRTANRRLGLQRGGLAHYVAAIRECFEEVGVLLAYDPSGALLDFAEPAVAERFATLRNRLNAGETTIRTIAEEEGLRLATDRVTYWSHWITPLGEPRRYDTRFFIAPVPARQTAVHDRRELTGSAWVTPGEALDRARRREWLIILPTLMNLKALASHPTAEAAIAWAASQPLPLRANLPRVYRGRVVLPGDSHYDEAEPDARRVDRSLFERPVDS